MAVKANGNYVLCLKKREVDEDFSNSWSAIERLRRELDELNQQSFFELSDRQGNIVAYIGDDGEVYVPEDSDWIIKEIKGELTTLDD